LRLRTLIFFWRFCPGFQKSDDTCAGLFVGNSGKSHVIAGHKFSRISQVSIEALFIPRYSGKLHDVRITWKAC
jgi:hypothetical protein